MTINVPNLKLWIFLVEYLGNPSSSLHPLGRNAADAVEQARSQVAQLIGAKPGEIVFTSGATESNNLAIFGVAAAYKGPRRRLVTSPIEHKAVLEPMRRLSQEGFELVYLPVDSKGRVDLEAAQRLIDQRTLLVSVQAANNEIGTLQPMGQIAALAKEAGAFVHCDAAQAVGKVPVDVGAWGVDLLSLSAHKIYGPKGVGALYIRQDLKKSLPRPQVLGGGQEWGLRSGTLNVPGIVGLGAACAIAEATLDEEARRIATMRDAFEQGLSSRIPGICFNGDLDCRLPGNSSISFPDVEADALILNLPDIALSMGSACNSGALEPSYVLTAIGLSREQAYSTVRVGWGRFNSLAEVTFAIDRICSGYERLRAENPAAHKLS
ncbi:MAG: cysteine desulfurase IscS [Meiothermus sp.]|nr:MAG: cysteine desulfurase IscS [Meiothermus sp.]